MCMYGKESMGVCVLGWQAILFVSQREAHLQKVQQQKALLYKQHTYTIYEHTFPHDLPQWLQRLSSRKAQPYTICHVACPWSRQTCSDSQTLTHCGLEGSPGGGLYHNLKEETDVNTQREAERCRHAWRLYFRHVCLKLVFLCLPKTHGQPVGASQGADAL